MINIEKYLIKYVGNAQPFNKKEKRYSSLILAIRDARYISNRDMSSGHVTLKTEAALSPALWPGAIMYLIILELIGTCFSLKNTQRSTDNAIYRALRLFSDLSESQARAIEALRHSFAHNYGLTNINKKSNGNIVKSRTHHFILTFHPEGTLIKERREEWDGTFVSQKKINSTQINLWRLGDKVEEVFQNLVSQAESKNLELILQDGLDELKAKYTVII